MKGNPEDFDGYVVEEDKPAKAEKPRFPIEVKLQVPLKHGDEEITKLVFKRPMKVKDLRGVNITKVTFDDFALMIGRLVNLPTSVIEDMEMADFMAASEVVAGFLEGIPGTGNNA